MRRRSNDHDNAVARICCLARMPARVRCLIDKTVMRRVRMRADYGDATRPVRQRPLRQSCSCLAHNVPEHGLMQRFVEFAADGGVCSPANLRCKNL